MVQNNSHTFKYIVAALGLAATLTLASPLEIRSANEAPRIQVCPESIGAPGCARIAIAAGTCVDLTGGLAYLNKQISNVDVPLSFVCTFFSQFKCAASQSSTDQVTLNLGRWDFLNAPGKHTRHVNFNDQTSSFSCIRDPVI